MTRAEARRFRELADQFCRDRGVSQFEVCEVVAWAMERGALSMSERDQRNYFVDQLSASLSSDVGKDEQGRKVRLRYCLEVNTTGPDQTVTQQYLWAHVDEASERFLRESLLQQRGKIIQDQRALEANLAFVNTRLVSRGLRPIQMDLPWVREPATSI